MSLKKRFSTLLRGVRAGAKYKVLSLGIKQINPNDNVFHCCIQKSASQWLKKIFGDAMIFQYSGLKVHVPGKDFMKGGVEATQSFPIKTIVTPLYLPYEEFEKISKPARYKAFWIMRDPRDLVISRYFSLRNSHPIMNEAMERKRKQLVAMSIEDGITDLVDAINRDEYYIKLYASLSSWLRAHDDPSVKLFRYEDLIGPEKRRYFKALLNHCDIDLSEDLIAELLDKYSFEKLSGRQQGKEDESSHYRKGISGDWKNYFTDLHVKKFKENTGRLLVDLGYEESEGWSR